MLSTTRAQIVMHFWDNIGHKLKSVIPYVWIDSMVYLSIVIINDYKKMLTTQLLIILKYLFFMG